MKVTSMPQPRAILDIMTKFKENGELGQIKIRFEDKDKKRDTCELRAERTRFRRWEHVDEIREYYEEKEMVKPQYGQSYLGYFYPSTSIEDGLRRLLRFFFRRYHFSLIAFYEWGCGIDTEDFYTLILDELTNCQTKCSQFHLNIRSSPDVYSLFTGSQTTSIVTDPFNLDTMLENFSPWNRVLDFQVTPLSFDDLAAIRNFVQDWYDGDCGIVKSMCVYQSEEEGPFQWTAREVVEELSSDAVIAVKEEEKDGVADYFVEVYFRDEEDGRVLGVRYSQMERTLIVEEVMGYTGEDDQLRITRKAVTYDHIGRSAPSILRC